MRNANPQGRLREPQVRVAQAPRTTPLWQQTVLFTLVTMLVIALVAPAALAQDAPEERPAAKLHTVDARTGNLILNQPSATPPEVTLTVNGTPATINSVKRATDSDVGVATVLVIDTSALGDVAFSEFRDLAGQLIAAKAPSEQMAIVSTGSAAVVRSQFTRSSSKLLDRLDQLETKGAFYLRDGIDEAARLLDTTPSGTVRNVVVMAATADITSFNTPAVIRGEMLSIGGTGHVVGVNRDGFDVPTLTRFANESKGSITVVTDPETIVAEAFDTVEAAVNGTWIVDFDSPEIANGGELVATVDGQSITANFVKGSVTSGPTLTPVERPEPNRFALLTGGLAGTLGVLLGGLSIGMAAFALFLLFQKRESSIGSLLQPYEEDQFSEFEDEDNSFANNAIVSKAVDFTEDFADKRGLLDTAASKLEKANIALRPAEAMTMYFGIIMLFAALGFMFGPGIMGAFLGLLAGIAVPVLYLNYKGAKRRKKFVAQLPDMLQLLAGTLKAGYSFMQGIEAVSNEAESPMGDELKIVVTEAQLGKPVEEAMEGAAERMDSPDFAWAVMAVNIQREVGGNLAELLMTVSETMVARDRLHREVLALTAEGRVSAMVLGAMPILLGLAMYALNPAYIGVLFAETMGRILMGAAAVMITIGFLWMKKTIEIKI